jgi:hypothetical protein
MAARVMLQATFKLPSIYFGGQGPSIGLTLTTRNSGSDGDAPMAPALVDPALPVAPAPAVAAAFALGTRPPTICTRLPENDDTSAPLRR